MSQADRADKKLVVGIGSALVDILARADASCVERCGAVMGGMMLVDSHNHIENALATLPSDRHIVPGGSACNTVMGIGRLGGRSRFVGKLGNDELGRIFRESLIKNNIEPALFDSDLPTGRVLSIVTPDAQRSMLTFLGASAQTHPNELKNGCLKGAAIVHVEGYLVFNRALIETALAAAKAAGAMVSLDLASHNVVAQHRDLLEGLIRDFVDVVIANEDEAFAYTGFKNEEKALEKLVANNKIGVVKSGPLGSIIGSDGSVYRIRAFGDGTAVDTTGAGDLWASGFLYGLAHGLTIEQSGILGSACGYEVCQVMGAAIPEQGWERIQNLLETFEEAKHNP